MYIIKLRKVTKHLNKEDNMRKMITEGVDFITTDQPETAQAIINEMHK